MNPLVQFQHDLQASDLPTALRNLGEYLAQAGRLHELFELRKIQLRQRIGLPIEQWQPIDDLPPELGRELETGLLEICREIGSRFMRDGDVVTGWSYLEPVGDKELARRLLDEIPVTADNAEAIIHLYVGRGLDPGRGFSMVLERFGTCTGITTYETQIAAASLDVRRSTAGLLVEHVYRELLGNIQRNLGDEPPADTIRAGELRDVLARHPELTEGLGHQIDTTHLASTVRYSRILVEPRLIERAIELAEYGARLHSDFQYRGTPPFEATYRDTLQFLRALRGENQEAEIARLAALARDRDDDDRLLDPAAWYIYLLDQLGRGDEAVSAWLELLHPCLNDEHILNDDVLRPLATMVRDYGLYEMAETVLRERGDLLQFATLAALRQTQPAT